MARSDRRIPGETKIAKALVNGHDEQGIGLRRLGVRFKYEDPLVHLPMWNVQVDIRHPRRSLNDEEFLLLVPAAANSTKCIEGMTGP
ncbi:hypothetical protein [Stieleria marina]|uniref:hypothetical protein n=1 Tax=Stieleria marina TaxID=1930275 RepID=UPI003AF367C7